MRMRTPATVGAALVVAAAVVNIPFEALAMRIGSIAPLTYTPGKLEYFQFIRGGIG